MDSLRVENVGKKESLEEQLLVSLEKLLLDYNHEISEGLCAGLNALLSAFKSQGVSLTRQNAEQPVLVFGKANLSRLLKQNIDPHIFEMQKILHNDLNLDIHLTESSLINFKLNKVSEYCDNLLNAARSVSLNIELNASYRIASDLTIIRFFILNIYSLVSDFSFKTCKACFRKVLTNKYCWLHKTANVNFYQQTMRVMKFQDLENKIFIEDWKNKRGWLGDHPNLIPSEIGKYKLMVNENINTYKNTVAITQPIYDLLKSFSQLDWKCGKNAIDNFIKNELPMVNTIVQGLTTDADSFSDYVRIIYKPNFLDNRYETSTSELWFFFTLLEAESWFNAEELAKSVPDLRVKNTLKRDEELIMLRREGMSIRKISKELNISKSLVEKKCKNISLN